MNGVALKAGIITLTFGPRPGPRSRRL
jgi:hypothetical protein